MLLGLAACSAALPDQARSVDAPLDCVSLTRPIGAQDAARIAEFRRAVESGPFYEALAAQTAPAQCRVRFEEGTIELEYRFRDGSQLVSRRDERIEFAEQTLRLASVLREDPVALLRRAERAAYGAKGCAIDWQTPEAHQATAGGREEVFYGDTCNCQARIRYDGTQRAVGLTLRSAC
jgi:hypothetical protein